MSKIQSFQQCQSLSGWQPIRVKSSSNNGFYLVHVNPWGIPEDNLCECRGYEFRGYCKHQHEALEQICGWHEMVGTPQTEEQKKKRICPLCHKGTEYTMEMVDDNSE